MVEKFAHIKNDMSSYAFWTNYIDWREPTPDDDPKHYGDVYVLASEYDHLAAERDALSRRINSDGTPVEIASLCKEIDEVTDDNAALRAKLDKVVGLIDYIECDSSCGITWTCTKCQILSKIRAIVEGE